MSFPGPQTPREHLLQSLLPKWVAMGPGRSLPALADEEGIDTMELVRHAKKFAWNAALQAATLMANTIGQMAESIADVNSRHLKVLKAAQQKAWDYLENVVFDKPADAIRLLIETTRLERTVRGLDDHKEDLGTVIEERLKNLGVVSADQIEFNYDPKIKIQALPENTDG